MISVECARRDISGVSIPERIDKIFFILFLRVNGHNLIFYHELKPSIAESLLVGGWVGVSGLH